MPKHREVDHLDGRRDAKAVLQGIIDKQAEYRNTRLICYIKSYVYEQIKDELKRVFMSYTYSISEQHRVATIIIDPDRERELNRIEEIRTTN